YRGQGKFAEALPVAKRALGIKEKVYGENQVEVARCLSNLALIQIGLAQYADAEQSLNRALTIEETNYGSDHPNVAKLLDVLSDMYKKQGKAELSVWADARAKQIRRNWR
ncbi:MAG: tetratricopeptide repeat protein, partial [Gallionella sp.]|nr:tetratricopeptide repeat protein [Gallionella sp.]